LTVKEGVEKYRTQSIHYLENAFSFIKASEAEKAGEFLWGSLAQALKAVAASKGIELKTHWDITDYAKALAKQQGDRSIFDVFGHASYLHSNFYEAGLRIKDVVIYAEEIGAMVRKLLALIPTEKREQEM
jgi:hypothetical protein